MSRRNTRSASPTNGDSPTKKDYAPANPSHLRQFEYPPDTPKPVSTSPSHFSEPLDYFGGYVDNVGSGTVTSAAEGGNAFLPDSRPSHAAIDRVTAGNSRESSGETSPEGPATPLGYHSYPATPGYGGFYGSSAPGTSGVEDGIPSAINDGLFSSGKKTMTGWLAQKNGVEHPRLMYVTYYIPFLNWFRQYEWRFFTGDLIAALTMASFYIPMSLSYASNLAHIPAINGLYAFAINPIIYALLGTCPQMVVGPEAAGSLLTGNVVRDSISRGRSHEGQDMLNAQIAGVVTGVAGAILLIAGGARLGFLDNVLSRPFLRGFISAIGIVILIDQLIPELGLSHLAAETRGVAHGSCIDKLMFLVRNVDKAHALTAGVSLGSFAVILVCREIKKRLQPRYPYAAYFPDRFLIVVSTTLLCWRLHWDKQGLPILGDVQSASGHPFPATNPFNFSNLKHIDSALSTSFVIALLGFFESSVAAKSLGGAPTDGIQNMHLSSNRELIALGVANIVGGVFMAIPAFGGYGRSKVNASTGGKTPMSSILLSLITILCILFVLPWFYYIPRGVLSAMISVVAYSLIEEAPHDLHFFWQIRGWMELSLIFVVFAATVFYSLTVGIACGIGFSLLRVIHHATRPRIQILGRERGTADTFENAEADPERFELIEGCLIVKIPEPLTFANTGELKARLDKLMNYGTSKAHPALPRVRRDHHNKNIIFDVHGVTSLDGAGVQVLKDILQGYRDRHSRVFFCRVAGGTKGVVWRLLRSSGIVELVGGDEHFVGSVREALRLSEVEDVIEGEGIGGSGGENRGREGRREGYRDDPDQ